MLDVPLARYKESTDFWCAVTDSEMSTARGDAGEFQTFLPRERHVDPFLRSQRYDDGATRVHLDLHIGDVTSHGSREILTTAVAEALGLGARLLHDADTHTVLSSPGGYVFCLVGEGDEQRRPSPVEGALVDQLCLDVPAPSFEQEVRFWAALTGWRAPDLAPDVDLVPLFRPRTLPLRLLLQRLGEDPRTTVTAHFDLASADREQTVRRHQLLGARVVAKGPRWTTLADPTGLPYCVTDRDPRTGLLAAP